MAAKQALKDLEGNLKLCLSKDRHRLKRKIRKVCSQIDAGKTLKESIPGLANEVEASMAGRETRLQNIPSFEYPDLPVAEKKDQIAKAILENQVVIVCGETGSGKTTQLPKICLSIGRGVEGVIGHTQPRRIAARSVGSRIAEELGESIGHSVGYKIRFQDHTRDSTYIKLMTDGILLAEIQTNPFLDQYDTIILDEAHERSLNNDFLMGYLKWLLPKRRDLKIIITSATIDPQRFSKHFDNAPIIEVSGRTYPVEQRYRPVRDEEGDETERDLQQAIVDAVDELTRERVGDILIFLTGEREIRETAENLRKHHHVDSEILPLYSRLSAAEQERIFKPHGKLRIVLATNVAETSLTVPGIRCVIDSGHARISRYSPRSKIQRLPIEKISQASANQRAGRCGRLGPGICIRLYSEDDFNSRPEFTDPEILRTNLAAVILQMKALRLQDITQFPFVEPPGDKMIRDGVRTLEELFALDSQRNLTAVGRKLMRLPIDPRLGRMLVAAEEHCVTEVAIIVAALSVQDPRERPAEKAQAADEKHARFKVKESDFLSFLKLWEDYEEQKKHLSNSKLRKYCRDNFLSYIRMREWQDIHQQLMRVLKGELKVKPNQSPAEYSQIHQALLTGLLSTIGFKKDQAEYQGARNLKFFIHPGSALHKSRPKWIVAGEQVETTKVYARHVAKIEPEWIEKAGSHLVNRQHFEPHWERKPARAAVYERTLLYGLTLANRRKIPYENVDPEKARQLFLRSALANQDYDSNATFFRHNQALLESLGYLQHKGRRVDLIVDEEWLYQFYDERVPSTVVNGVTFEKWRKKAERKNPELLKLTEQQIIKSEDAKLDDKQFPDIVTVNNIAFKLEYRFEPGHNDDGVSVIIPIHQLNQVNTAVFEWGVPGLLREKLIEMVKALPKLIRKNFVPVPDYVDRCLERLDFGKGTLQNALGIELHKITGIRVPVEAWNDEALPDHLRINFKVVDDDDKFIASARNFKRLVAEHGNQAGAVFNSMASGEFSHSGCTDWVFGDLPEFYENQNQGNLIYGYPALVDEGETVGVKLFDTSSEAEESHRRGLIRLLHLKLRKEVRGLRKDLSVKPAAELFYRNASRASWSSSIKSGRIDAIEDIVGLVLETVFLSCNDSIRSDSAMDACLKANKANLYSTANEISAAVTIIFGLAANIKKSLAAIKNKTVTLKDLEEQLDRLTYGGFLQTTPFTRIKHIPRYLNAMQYRLEKALQAPSKDQQKYAELRPFWQRYWEIIDSEKTAFPVMPERDEFRWQLEEFRVSLFAQNLKTPYPVSAKRLEKAWAQKTSGN